jgi:hypothetical protein
MSLLSVPNEILTIIAEGITELKHLNALVRTSRKLYLTLNLRLYKLALPSDEDHESVLHWALNTSQISTVDLLLANRRKTPRAHRHNRKLAGIMVSIPAYSAAGSRMQQQRASSSPPTTARRGNHRQKQQLQ